MESKKFSIGDIVSLKAHPYVENLTEVIISGDHLTLPPLMIIGEVSKSSYQFAGKKNATFKYRCFWFQPKTYKFKDVEINEELLKLIAKGRKFMNEAELNYGTTVNFKTVPYELSKKKSTLTYDDNNQNTSSPSSTINALLSFLPPILHVIGIETHKTEHPVTDKGEKVRLHSTTKVKFNYYNVIDITISEHSLPIELLGGIEMVDEKRLLGVEKIIQKSGYLYIGTRLGKTVIVKPKTIANRCGYYFLRAFNYVSNKVEEFEFTNATKIKLVVEPFLVEVPKFDIIKEPISATASFISKEIVDTTKLAISDHKYLRINYLNRNDQVTVRSVKNLQYITVKENGKDVDYLVGYCMLRNANRTFRVDRIQSAQVLNLLYKVK